ncbi:MAG TPA: PAS domain-containing protein [Opitutus sp.]|nr:PAS domain-containing protein [Opitutus sp.]
MSPAGRFRILLVEDNPADVVLLRHAFSDQPNSAYELATASRLAEARDRLDPAGRAEPCDLVLLDLGLPDSQGLATFTKLRTAAPDVPVLVLTGLNDEDTGIAAVQTGAQDYLVKGQIQPELLWRSVRYAIERHHHAAALERSERRFHLAVSGSHAGLWDWNPQTDEIFFAPRFKELLGYADAEFPHDLARWRELIHPDDRPKRFARLKAHLESCEPYDDEFRARVRTGDYRWFQARGQAQWDAQGRAYRMVGWIMDITARKRAESDLEDSREALRHLAGRLRAVREEERTHIAREIHDELGQMLTGLKMDLRAVARKLAVPPSPEQRAAIDARLVEAARLADRTIELVQRIAIELRPGALDNLGLVEALRDEARRFEQRTGTHFTLHLPADVPAAPPPVGTAFFRIFQELLSNIARHAGATQVEVRLADHDGMRMLDVRDNGRGFSPDSVSSRTALGLLGMHERAIELGGHVEIESRPGHGTRATVRIPFPFQPT